jgi:hypothetical protein
MTHCGRGKQRLRLLHGIFRCQDEIRSIILPCNAFGAVVHRPIAILSLVRSCRHALVSTVCGGCAGINSNLAGLLYYIHYCEPAGQGRSVESILHGSLLTVIASVKAVLCIRKCTHRAVSFVSIRMLISITVGKDDHI